MQRRKRKRRKRLRRSVGRQRNPCNTSLLSSLSIQLSIEHHRLQLGWKGMNRIVFKRDSFFTYTRKLPPTRHTPHAPDRSDDGGRGGHTSQYKQAPARVRLLPGLTVLVIEQHLYSQYLKWIGKSPNRRRSYLISARTFRHDRNHAANAWNCPMSENKVMLVLNSLKLVYSFALAALFVWYSHDGWRAGSLKHAATMFDWRQFHPYQSQDHYPPLLEILPLSNQ